jgi:putative lipoic acid-binding regulatory protein
MSKESEFYDKLKKSLEETSTFPSDYMYKFIIPTSEEKFKNIESLFDNMGAVIKSKPSKTGKYDSLTILVKMKSADDIIEKYIEVSKIDGVISL